MVNLEVKLRQNGVQICSLNTDVTGRYIFNPCSWADSKRSVMPDINYKNEPYNGVTTFDLVLISKHIEGIQLFTDPFQYLAADVDYNAHINSLDIKIARAVILGIILNFPNNRSWGYVPNLCTGTQVFLNQFNDNNPFDPQFLDPFDFSNRTYKCAPTIPNNCTWMDHVNVVSNNPLAQFENTWSLTAVKIGDVNCGAVSNGLEDPPPNNIFESETGYPIAIPQGTFKKIQVIAEAAQNVSAWQFGTSFPASSLHIWSFMHGDVSTTFDSENFHFADGTGSENGISHLNAVWYSSDGTTLNIGEKILFEFGMQATTSILSLENLLQLNGSKTPFKFYNAFGAEVSVQLKLKAVNWNGLQRGEGRGASDQKMKNIVATPNPFGSDIAFSFEVSEPTSVQIQLLAADGRLIARKSGEYPSGQHRIEISSLENLAAGIYSYLVVTKDETYRRNIIKR